MEKIRRKSLLYRSGLGFWCINHVLGCAHSCRYPCYAYLMAKHYGRTRDWSDWRRPRLVENAVELLERELATKGSKTRACAPESRAHAGSGTLTGQRAHVDDVHLCLTTDPFMMGYPEVSALSLALVERMNARDVRASVLTKGILPSELAGPRFNRRNTLGISLVSLDEGFRRRFEPGAAPYVERIAALERLHAAGCRTLVHIEPYPTPNIVRQDVEPLLEAVAFVDELYFGGWNYSSLPGASRDPDGFYRSQGHIVRAFCEQHNIAAMIGC